MTENLNVFGMNPNGLLPMSVVFGFVIALGWTSFDCLLPT